MIKIKINNKEYLVNDNMTILEVCHKYNIKIPTLCYLKDISEEASCRMCVVELQGRPNLVPACKTKVMEGMDILTNSPKVIKARKTTLELILAHHNKNCLSCEKSGKCELQNLANLYQVEASHFGNMQTKETIDDGNHCIIRDNSKCILCNRCVNFCKNVQGVEAIKKNERGLKSHISSAFDMELASTKCVMCGGCVSVCPTGALREKTSIDDVREALLDKNKKVIVAYAPSVRVALGEEFNIKEGTNVAGKLNTALRELGFETIYDVNFTADFTIFEEATELIERIKNKENLPLMTSCCPGWVNYVRKHFPKYIDNLSSVKSPQQMYGALCKTYYAKINNIDPKNIYVVSIMPCIAKKHEIYNRDYATKYMDVDCVLTTREIARMIKEKILDFENLESSDFDRLFGKGYSGIFGASGGVMEAALRFAKEKLEHKNYDKLEFHEVRGLKGLKEATYEINGLKLKVLVASGLKNIYPLLKDGSINKYHFVEVMACPGGCINGAGQPYVDIDVRNFGEYREKRSKGLYQIDKTLKTNKAKDNNLVKQVYKDYLDSPGSLLAHQILHTKYKKKDN